jgi:mono/diheme cytochrome c family protein/cytochrome c551/c552
MTHRKTTKTVVKQACLFALCLTVVFCTGILQAQHDPGPRGGAAGAGGFYPTLDGNEQAFFSQALDRFKEIDSVSGNVPGEAGVGLGPTFNANSCAACHAQPDVGGSSPGLRSPQKPVPNPQVAFATLDGATNTVPPFINANGPVREARFVSTNTADPYAALDGGVHGLYTIKGRSDAIGCNLQQPDFATQLANHNVIFRIPTPTFGLGLIENTPDAVLEANLAANSAAKSTLGIIGKLNRTGNDGTVTRFGWKAQNKSLVIFSGEAYNVEQGVANEVFPNERAAVPGCVFNSTPEDSTNITNPDDPTSTTGTASKMSSDTVNFAAFMRLTAPPTATTHTASELNGQKLFSSVGCVLCHSDTLTTGQSPFTGMSNVAYHPYSDIAVHHMGSNLADGVNQGGAGPDEFRTAPLWGVGQRLFFLHDGRTSNLLQAIQAHASSGNICVVTQDFQQFSINNGVSYFQPFSQSQTCGSEANGVISNFNSLSSSQKQDLLNFLRSL